MPVDPRDFRDAMGRFAAGVTVLTVVGPDGGARGMTASAVCSVSLDPPLLLVCVKRGNKADQLLQNADGFALSFLGEGQSALSNRFAGFGDGATDDFSDLDIDHGPVTGAPWLRDAIARVDCKRHDVLDGGDHNIYLGRIEAVDCPGERDAQRPLLYFAGSYRAVGVKL